MVLLFFFFPLFGEETSGALWCRGSQTLWTQVWGACCKFRFQALYPQNLIQWVCAGAQGSVFIYLFIYLFKFLYLYSFFFHFSCFIFYAITDVSFSPFTPLHPAHLHFYSQSPPHCPRVHHVCSVTDLFPFFQSVAIIPLSSYSCQSMAWFHSSGSVLLISLFCSLDSSYKWDHMIFVFHQLTYFT